jgi:hypothetical protein
MSGDPRDPHVASNNAAIKRAQALIYSNAVRFLDEVVAAFKAKPGLEAAERVRWAIDGVLRAHVDRIEDENAELKKLLTRAEAHLARRGTTTVAWHDPEPAKAASSTAEWDIQP